MKLRTRASMHRFTLSNVIAATVLTIAPESLVAETAPVEESELLRSSDLVIDVDVRSVTKNETQSAVDWLAILDVTAVVKGQVPRNPIPYRFLPPEGIPGERNEAVYAGQRLRMFLVRNQYGRLVPWASNSIQRLEPFPEQREVLPKRAGERIEANGRRVFVSAVRSRSTIRRPLMRRPWQGRFCRR